MLTFTLDYSNPLQNFKENFVQFDQEKSYVLLSVPSWQSRDNVKNRELLSTDNM